MPLFNVTHQPSGRTLHIRAACRTCARRIAVEHIALTGPTAEWRDPEQTRVDFVGSGDGPSKVLTDTGPAYPCWCCSRPVSLQDRLDADGDCPHCRAELDLENWPRA